MRLPETDLIAASALLVAGEAGGDRHEFGQLDRLRHVRLVVGPELLHPILRPRVGRQGAGWHAPPASAGSCRTRLSKVHPSSPGMPMSLMSTSDTDR